MVAEKERWSLEMRNYDHPEQTITYLRQGKVLCRAIWVPDATIDQPTGQRTVHQHVRILDSAQLQDSGCGCEAHAIIARGCELTRESDGEHRRR